MFTFGVQGGLSANQLMITKTRSLQFALENIVIAVDA